MMVLGALEYASVNTIYGLFVNGHSPKINCWIKLDILVIYLSGCVHFTNGF